MQIKIRQCRSGTASLSAVAKNASCLVFVTILKGYGGETENRKMPGHIGGFLKEAPNQ